MKEIRIHGRGGQGVVIAAELLVTAFIKGGKHAAGFPFFGSERRGAPVRAFVRFDEAPIREKSQVYSPDCLLLMDPRQLTSPDVFVGLRHQGMLVANHAHEMKFESPRNLELIGVVDATRIALQEIGISVPNTCMVGAFAATTGWVKKDVILEAIGAFFSGTQLEKNLRCAERGFESVEIRREIN